MFLQKTKASNKRHCHCLLKHHIMKKCGEVEVKIHTFLTSTLDGGEW